MCDYPDCEEPAEFYDDMDNKVCGECMCREIGYGADGESFERITTDEDKEGA